MTWFTGLAHHGESGVWTHLTEAGVSPSASDFTPHAQSQWLGGYINVE